MTTGLGCLDCGRAKTATTLPHGRLCIGCRRRRHYHQRPCAACGQIRPLGYRVPNPQADRQPEGQPDGSAGADAWGEEDVCAGCAGMKSVFACRECGSEAHPYGYTRCAHCYLRELLTAVLTDPATGTIHHQLVAVFDTLIESRRPQTTLWWLTKPGSVAAGVFEELATGRLPISHDTFRDRLPVDRRHGYLRDLLTSTGVLEPYAPAIERIHPWLVALVEQHPAAHAEILNRFARWHVLRRMRQHAAAGTLTSSIVNGGRSHILAAGRLLAWTHQQQTTITALTQTQLENYLSHRQGAHSTLSRFLVWLGASRTNTTIKVTHRPTQLPEVTMTDEARWRRVELLLHDNTINSYSRVAGLFLLLFAQPLNKIMRMTRDQVAEHAGGRVFVTFDTVPIQLPPDVGELLLDHMRGYSPASYRAEGADWLFPGRLPGRSMHTEPVRRVLVSHGIHPRKSRSTATFALAGHIPTPVLADLLGISRNTATRWAALAARDWSAYIAHR